jgi:hypothetical protein
MSSTTTHPNNARIKFRGRKEREMAKTTMPAHVDPKMPPGSMKTPKAAKMQGPKYGKRVRKRARSAFKRGLISEKAMAKHMGGE